jgi:hypothetical protein
MANFELRSAAQRAFAPSVVRKTRQQFETNQQRQTRVTTSSPCAQTHWRKPGEPRSRQQKSLSGAKFCRQWLTLAVKRAPAQHNAPRVPHVNPPPPLTSIRPRPSRQCAPPLTSMRPAYPTSMRACTSPVLQAPHVNPLARPAPHVNPPPHPPSIRPPPLTSPPPPTPPVLQAPHVNAPPHPPVLQAPHVNARLRPAAATHPAPPRQRAPEPRVTARASARRARCPEVPYSEEWLRSGPFFFLSRRMRRVAPGLSSVCHLAR